MVPDKKRKKVKRLKKIERATLTISLPDQVKEWVRKKENYSAFIASLLKSEMEKEQQVETPVVTEEEKEIRKALEERERLLALYGNDVYDVEYAIRKGFDPDKEMVQVEDWRKYMEAKGVNDRYGYFPAYAKYCGELTPSKHYDLWMDIKERFEAEMEEQRMKDLEKEVTGGFTKREILDKVAVYRKRQFEQKMKRYEQERAKILSKAEDASGYVIVEEINKIMTKLKREYDAKGVALKDVLDALGLPYMVVYNKVLAILRREGYKIIT